MKGSFLATDEHTRYSAAVERRGSLMGFDNPQSGYDYIVALDHQPPPGPAGNCRVSLKVRYIPDRLILDIKSFETYAANLARLKWQTLEELAAAVIDDLNNELVPRWVRVIASGSLDQEGKAGQHRVYCEDRQPQWGNITLLASLDDG